MNSSEVIEDVPGALARPAAWRGRLARIASLGLPIVGGMISQNVFNLVDTAMVGHLGDAALAAVGTASFLHFFSVSVMMGLSHGVQAMAARRIGEGQVQRAAVPLNGALVLAVLGALPLTILVYCGAPTFFPWVNDSPQVVAEAVPYQQWRALSILGVALNLCFRGHWNGVDRSRFYLRSLLLMHVANIVCNYTLIFGKFGLPAMGTSGAGLGSVIATYLGLVYHVSLGLRHARSQGFLKVLPEPATRRTIVRLAIPGGVQQLFFSGGYTAMFWILGQVGLAEAAAANVLMNVMLVAILPGMALGMATTTLVGQSLGRGRPEEATAWGWDVMKVAGVALGLLGLPMVVSPSAILGLFIRDAQTLQVATLPLVIFGATIALDGMGAVLLFALIGAGAMRTTMVVSIACQWLVFLPVAYLVGPYWGFGITGVWIALCSYRALQSAVFAYLWKGRAWQALRI